MTINQMTSLVKALNADANGSVLVTIEAVRPMKAHAPTGKGLKTKPAIVDKKMARSCHACGVTSMGLGTRKRTMRPIETERNKGKSLAPCGGGGEVVLDGGSLPFREAAARIVERRGLDRLDGAANERGLIGDRRVGVKDEGKMNGWDDFVMGLERR
ncbi:hypothetical protein V6N12_012178 [Hibiscus sabdariffa]|uniref:Uncharacterized protein n=1 Tax=Hibiscus sabdariffa TaxID=183260 RepID=A0ABR2CHC4_9ROSI